MFPCTNLYPDGKMVRGDYAAWCVYMASRPDLQPKKEDDVEEMVATQFYGADYERTLRDAFFKVVSAYPKDVFDLVVIFKTRAWVGNIRDALTIRASPLIPAVLPFLLLQILGFCLFTVTLHTREVARLMPILASLFALSLLPGYAFIPVLHTTADAILFLFMGLASVVACTLAWVARLTTARRALPDLPDARAGCRCA
jgi:hypothetical protein